MYKIEKEDYGFKLVFSDQIDEDEMHCWLNELKRSLTGLSKEFGVLVDLRKVKPLHPQTQEFLEAGQRLFKNNGMIRSAVILKDSVILAQFKHFAVNSGISIGERYTNATEEPNWEGKAIAWIINGVEPNKKNKV